MKERAQEGTSSGLTRVAPRLDSRSAVWPTLTLTTRPTRPSPTSSVLPVSRRTARVAMLCEVEWVTDRPSVVAGYPTLLFVPSDGSEPQRYQQGRDEQSILNYLNEECGTDYQLGGGIGSLAGRIVSDNLAPETASSSLGQILTSLFLTSPSLMPSRLSSSAPRPSFASRCTTRPSRSSRSSSRPARPRTPSPPTTAKSSTSTPTRPRARPTGSQRRRSGSRPWRPRRAPSRASSSRKFSRRRT